MNRLACAMAIGVIALGAAVFPVSALAGSDAVAPQTHAAISAQAVPPLSALDLTLTRRWSGLSQPIYFTAASNETTRAFVVEKRGTIRIVKPGGILVARPYLDLRSKVSRGTEQGLLGLAFAPDFTRNGRFYVNYTDTRGDTIIARYTASDPGSDETTFSAGVTTRIAQPYPNHNGGCLQFGPNRYLYIGTGDGGGSGDPGGRAQNPRSRLGKILRIDVGERPGATLPTTYRIPPSNPYVGKSGYNPSIWARGLRNPWRFSFDRATGGVWIGDVGQSRREEIDYMRPAVGGYNFGWDRFEGFATYPPGARPPANRSKYRKPVVDHRHPYAESITGGYVYRGSAYPKLRGTYVYGDFIRGKIWGLRVSPSLQRRLLRNTSLLISSFGEDAGGELYFCDMKYGTIYQVGAR